MPGAMRANSSWPKYDWLTPAATMRLSYGKSRSASGIDARVRGLVSHVAPPPRRLSRSEAGTALDETPVRHDRRRRHVARAVAGQEGDHAGDLLRLGHPAQRNGGVDGLELHRIVESGLVDRGDHRAGPDPDHRDPVGGELNPGCAGEHPHAALGQAIRRVPGHWPVLVDRGHVDDPPSAALGDHLLRRQLGPEEGALEVDVEHLLVLLLGAVEHRAAGLDASVVDHDVEPPEGLDRAVNE